MDYRRLGASGFTVPALSFGTGTFGGKGEFFAAWGSTDVAEASRLIDICLDAGLNMFDTADIYSGGAAEEVLGGAIKGRPRDGLIISTKATFRSGEAPNRVGSSRYHLVATVEEQLKRLGTDYIDLFQLHRLRCPHAGRRGAVDARSTRAPGQDPLHRCVELLRLARDEVAGRLRPARISTLRRQPDLLFAGRPRLRMGADAAGDRPGARRRGVESPRLGSPHRQDPPRPAAARA